MSDSPINGTLLSEETFDNIFTEVTHDNKLPLQNPNQLRIFHLDMPNNEFDFTHLKEFLEENIGSYVFSRAKIDNLYAMKKERSIDFQARKEMLEMANNNLSEMMIYLFLEHVLEAPKLISKVELASTGNVSNSDSVHLHTLSDNLGTYYQMVFGVSNIVGDIRDAIDNAFLKIKKINDSKQDEVRLVDKTVLGQSFDEETTEKIKGILLPSKDSPTTPSNAFGIFLGYSLGLKTTTRSVRQFPTDAVAKMKFDIENHVEYIADKINKLGLNAHSFYIYIMPFNDAISDSEDVLDQILPGRLKP